MSMRKTPQQIEDGIRNGFDHEAWNDLVADFNYTNDPTEDQRLLVLCAKFLQEHFPTEAFGWQDFDILISTKFVGRWNSRLEYAAQVSGEEVQDIEDIVRRERLINHLASLSDEEFTRKFFAGHSDMYAVDAQDGQGGVAVFSNVKGLESILRD